ncbi:MAG TPA: tetratricopeptide repeat protein, partial [Thermoanaerobaculia bacterium]
VQSAAVKRERDRATGEEVKANAVVDLLTEVLQGADPDGAASSPVLDVNELLARGENRAAELSSQLAVQARLWHVLGKVHLARSNFAKARQLLASAHERQVGIGGTADPRAMEMDIDLARADAMIGSRGAAAMRLRNAIVQLEQKSPPQTALLARALDGLADVSDRNRQEPLLRRALELRSRLVPPNPILVAQSLNQLGIVAAANGQSAAAERYYRKALELLEHSLPADHPTTLEVRSNLALTAADLSERKDLFHDLIAAHTRRYGAQSAPVATAWTNFGATLAEQGDFPGAMAALREARDRWLHIVGPHHEMTINAWRSIAAILELERRPEESLSEMRGILAAAERSDINPTVRASLRAQEAGVLFRLGRLSESKREMQAAFDDLCRLEPEGADDRTDVQFWIGRLLLAEKKTDEADAHLSAVLAARSRSFPPGHPRIAEAQVALGRTRIARGRVADGRALISGALEIYSRFPLAHPDDVEAGRRALNGTR